MERMALIEAAARGDVDQLRSLIGKNPLVLRNLALDSGNSPLHIACTGGHVSFVNEVLTNLSPEFAKQLNKDGFSPLHIASANGDVEIVKVLLKVDGHLCLLKGKENRIPLHYAAAQGRTVVIRELLSTCSDSISELTVRGETCFHLAAENNQFEAFKALCRHVIAAKKEDILDKKDEQGNTVLHLAASRKQYEFVRLLLDKSFGYKDNLELNSSNKQGLTPLDALLSEGGDREIEEMLVRAGALGHGAHVVVLPQNSACLPSRNSYDREFLVPRISSTYLGVTPYVRVLAPRISSAYSRITPYDVEFLAPRISSTYFSTASCDLEFTRNIQEYPTSRIPSTYYISVAPYDKEYPTPRTSSTCYLTMGPSFIAPSWAV